MKYAGESQILKHSVPVPRDQFRAEGTASSQYIAASLGAAPFSGPVELPPVAVVIPCYNASKWIERSVGSVLEQMCPDLQLIVIDDGSTDNTTEVLNRFGKAIQTLSGPNCGACAARNRGLQNTTAEYILFLDADDYITQGSLTAWLSAASQMNADIVLGPFAYEREGRLVLERSPYRSTNPTAILRQWLLGHFTPTCSVLWRRTFVEQIGGWNARAKRNQDGEIVLRGLLSQARLAIAEQGLGVYVQHNSPDRISKSSGREGLSSELAIMKELSEIAKVRGYETVLSAFSHAFYEIACRSFLEQVDDVGSAALAEARKLGFRGHRGTLGHRIIAGLLGLRLKFRLATLVRNARRFA